MSNGSPYDDENRTQIFADAPQIDADVRHAERSEGAKHLASEASDNVDFAFR